MRSRLWRRIATLLATLGLLLSFTNPVTAYNQWGGGLPNSKITDGFIDLCFKYAENINDNKLYDNRNEMLQELNDKFYPVNQNFIFANAGFCDEDDAEIEIEYFDGNDCYYSFGNPFVYARTTPLGTNRNLIEINKDCSDRYGTDFFDFTADGWPAEGKMNLFTLIAHEIGHALDHHHTSDGTHLNLMDTGSPSGSDPAAVEEYCGTATDIPAGLYGVARIQYWGRKLVELDRDFVNGVHSWYGGDNEDPSFFPWHLKCRHWDGTINGN